MTARAYGVLGLVAALVLSMVGLIVPAQAQEVTAIQADTFSRTVASGWGSAETGGAWQLSNTNGTSVNGSQGVILLPPGAFRTARLEGALTGGLGAQATFTLPDLHTQGEVVTGLAVRRVGSDYYFARVRIDASGNSYLAITANKAAGVSWSLTPEVPIGKLTDGKGLHIQAGSALTGQGAVVAKAWIEGQSTPAEWQVSATSADLPDSGEVGLRMQSSIRAQAVNLLVDDFEVRQEAGNAAPIASFVATTDGLFVNVDAEDSSDPDGQIVSYRYDYGDGSSATGVRPAPKLYDGEGDYTITLTVTDNLGATSSTTRQVTVLADNAPPVAQFTFDLDEFDASFDASTSTDPDGAITSYQWDFGDGTTGTGVGVDHSYSATGAYTVVLTVTDDRGGKGTSSQVVNVSPNQAPTATILAPYLDLRVLFDGRMSTDPDGEIVLYEWDLGDGTTAEGDRLPVYTYATGGTYTVTLTVTDDKGAQNTATKEVILPESTQVSEAQGAQLPVLYDLDTLPGTVRFVSPAGNDDNDGSEAKPFKTLQRAVNLSSAGDSVVIRGGTYDIKTSTASIGKANLTVTAYPGEIPVFDGSIPAPASAHADGALRWIDYQPVPASPGEGMSLSNLPTAQFDSSGNPTGLAKERGWRCISGASYQSMGVERDVVVDLQYSSPKPQISGRSTGSGCPGGTSAKVITGYYPDQAWVNDVPLVQVLEKALVKPGKFYVERDYSDDTAPGMSKLFLSEQDAADMSKVRVSSSSGNFIHIPGDGVKLSGIRVQKHSPDWRYFALTITSGTDDVSVSDVEFDSTASTAIKVAGGTGFDQAKVNNNVRFDRITVNHTGWVGLSALYADDLVVDHSRFTATNPDAEFDAAPVSGAIKSTKVHGMQVLNSEFLDNTGHALWWDQSCYDTVIANNKIITVRDAAVFYEISHKLTMVNNYIVRGVDGISGSATLRLVGSSDLRLVNNTIVGGTVPVLIGEDARSKSFGSDNRPCAEHPYRYTGSGNIGADCPPALTSDLDRAREGAYGNGPNVTPELDWEPSAGMLINNVIANPKVASGGACSDAYPFCLLAYSSDDSSSPANQLLPAGLQMDGNVYQSPDRVSKMQVPSGASGGFQATTIDQLKSSLAGSPYGLTVEEHGLAGTGWVDDSGRPTAALAARHADAAPVPTDAVVNEFIAAGSKYRGAKPLGTTTVPGGNIPPTAAFTLQETGNTVTVDASGSSDSDGEVLGYLWDFGDGSERVRGKTATEVSHTYELFGTFTIWLAIVDDKGALALTSKSVTIIDPDNAFLARDSFTRFATDGWGSADVGGAWALSGSALEYSADGSAGVAEIDPGQSRKGTLPSVQTDAGLVHAVLTVPDVITGGGLYASVLARVAADNSDYRAKVHIKSDGTAKVSLVRAAANGAETTIGTTTTQLSGFTVTSRLHIRAEAVGTSPTTIRTKIWMDGEEEPAGWAIQATDSTAALQAPGATGVLMYLSSSATAEIDARVDEYGVIPSP